MTRDIQWKTQLHRPMRLRKPGSIEVWRPSELDSVELHLGTRVAHPYPRHWHEEFHLSLITGGAGYLDCGGAVHFAPAGSLFLVPPGEVHANRACEDGCSFRNIYVPCSLVSDAVLEVTGRVHALPHFPEPLIEDPQIHQSFLHLHRTLERPESRLHQESVILSFFVNLITRHADVQPSTVRVRTESRAVRFAQDFLREHYARGVSLEELSRLTNLSPYYLHRTFCQQTGIPPHAYQLQVRIARAKSFLQLNRPLAEVAMATGFADQSHFTRHFKRLVGVTPGQYLRHSKNVQDGAAYSPLTFQR